MNLLIDTGNTSLKYAFYQNELLSKVERIQHSNLEKHYFEQHWKGVDNIVISSVADKKISNFIAKQAKQLNISVTEVKTPKQKFGITVGYQNNTQLGVDRWLAILGTKQMYPQANCLIIDLGTATTVDVLGSNGQHYGGWILPGLQTMQQSLFDKTANVKVDKSSIASIEFADNTSDNVVNGCLAALVGLVKVAIEQSLITYSTLDQIILTGGDAKYIEPYVKTLAQQHNVGSVIESELVFTGLQVYCK